MVSILLLQHSNNDTPATPSFVELEQLADQLPANQRLARVKAKKTEKRPQGIRATVAAHRTVAPPRASAMLARKQRLQC